MFSIITAVRNRADRIGSCLESVACQRDASFEHVVIDGGSTDGSREIISGWSDRLAYWVSEPDGGIADAMNKGIVRARGTWLLFLHADDQLLANDVLVQVASILAAADAGVCGFPIRFGSESSSRLIHPRGGNAWLRLKTGLLHQGSFIHRDVFDQIGVHRDDLRIAMDYEFFLRAWLRGVPFATFRTPVVSLMRDEGISSRRDWPSLTVRFEEEQRVQLMHVASGPARWTYRAYWAAYLRYRRLRHVFGTRGSR